MTTPVTIIMIEDDDGHARLIERNIRRSGVNNKIVPFTNGTEAVRYLFGKDVSFDRQMTQPKPTLLYIDDDKALARLVERGLTRLGLNVVHAPGGAAGLDRLKQGGIDVVALDQYMPGLDGLETLERILAIPNAPPVVVLTTTDDSQEIKRCYELGCNVYIVKPVNYENFAHAIRQLGLFFSVIQVPAAAS